jgi:hypothetical protein
LAVAGLAWDSAVAERSLIEEPDTVARLDDRDILADFQSRQLRRRSRYHAATDTPVGGKVGLCSS